MTQRLILLKVLALLFCFREGHAQRAKELETLARTPKQEKIFPLNYKIALPTADFDKWNADYERYRKFVTPAMQKTQMGTSFTQDGIRYWMISNSVIPHAQLDTTTMIQNPADLYGTWRLAVQRRIRFTDSVVYGTDGKIYRSEQLLDDASKTEDAFLWIDDKEISLSYKKPNKDSYKKPMSTKYSLENGRSLLLYRFLKGSATVAQIGLDENQNLILILPSVTEAVKPHVYNIYNAILEQFVFVKVK